MSSLDHLHWQTTWQLEWPPRLSIGYTLLDSGACGADLCLVRHVVLVWVIMPQFRMCTFRQMTLTQPNLSSLGLFWPHACACGLSLPATSAALPVCCSTTKRLSRWMFWLLSVDFHWSPQACFPVYQWWFVIHDSIRALLSTPRIASKGKFSLCVGLTDLWYRNVLSSPYLVLTCSFQYSPIEALVSHNNICSQQLTELSISSGMGSLDLLFFLLGLFLQ